MAESTEKTPPRSAAEKERSRQKSRAISGKEAARGVQGKPGAAQKPSPKGPQAKGAQAKGPQSRAPQGKGGQAGRGTGPGRGGPAKGQGAKGTGQRPPRGRAATPQRRPGRSSGAIITWSLIAVVLIAALAILIVKVTGNSGTSQIVKPKTVTSAILNDVLHVPASVYNAVGTSSPTDPANPPKAIPGTQPKLQYTGKTGILYVGAEYCPYCAAERWGMITAMARFGSVSGLKTMESSCSDVYPCTQTFTLAAADFKSTYVKFVPKEVYSNVPLPTGKGYERLQALTKAQTKTFRTFDTGKYTGSTSSGSFPFVDFDNKYIISGSSYSPSILQGLSRQQIAGDLSTSASPVTKAIIATANFISATTCDVDGEQPASVCKSKGVRDADQTMGIKSS